MKNFLFFLFIASLTLTGCDVLVQLFGDVVDENKKPSVYFTKPSSGQSFEHGANLGVIAQASDSDGKIDNVELYINNSLVRKINGEGPFKWGSENNTYPDKALVNLSAGTYELRVKATDDKNATGSASISITVKAEIPNQIPNAHFTRPNNGASFITGSALEVAAQASDSDGRISKVELLINNQSVRVDTSAPYSWSSQNSSDSKLKNLPIGNYTLKIVATDDKQATKSTSIEIKIKAPPVVVKSYICTKVKDNLNPYDYTYMGQKLDGMGFKKNIMDDNVSKSEFMDYFNRKVTFLYHTGHGSPGLISTSDGAFYYSNISQIAVANTFIATCLTLKNTGWMSKFGQYTNTFSGYTNVTYDSNIEIKIIDKFTDKIKNGTSYVMAFYLAHKDLNVYQDRWCIYAKKDNQVVEYSAKSGNKPREIGELVQVDEAGKVFAADSFYDLKRSNEIIYDGISIGTIRTRTSTPGKSLLQLRETIISESEAIQIAIEYIGKIGEIEVDQVIDRIIPIDMREEDDSQAKLGGWEVRFAKGMDDGHHVSCNGPTMHMTVLVTGVGEVISFRKRWAQTSLARARALSSDTLMPVIDSLNVSASEISNRIKQNDGQLNITGWKLVYGLDSSFQENSVLRPAYVFIDDTGSEVMVVDARDGSLL